MHGGVGWQGIIPSRAAKMGSIAVDKGIAKVGSPADFYEQLDPEKIAEHILDSRRAATSATLVERIMEREHPQLWHDLPPRVREARPRARPGAAARDRRATSPTRSASNIDQLLDVKLMVIRHIEEHPELANRIFLEVGRKELRFIINFGFFFGFLLGIPLVLLTERVCRTGGCCRSAASIIGYVTNWLGDLDDLRAGRAAAASGRSRSTGCSCGASPRSPTSTRRIIADDIVTLRNIGDELLHGPRSDRTRADDRERAAPGGRPRRRAARGPPVRVAVGTREYDAIRESRRRRGRRVHDHPAADPEFNRSQSAAQVRELIAERMREMPPGDFSEMLRSAMREDEWLLLPARRRARLRRRPGPPGDLRVS